MLNLAVIAAGSFMLALSGALVPGPLFTITVSETMKRGFVAGPLIILGHGLLEILIVVLLVFEITPFLAAEGTRFIIASAGGLILVVMGLMLIRDARRVKLEFLSGGKGPGMHPVLSGILGSLSNPYWTVWWITVGLGYLLSSLKFGISGVVSFFIGHISADLVWYSIISFTVARGRKVIGERGYRGMLYICGVFLIFFGGWFIVGV
jgi:threonine/homoserine/homoserine lactone efflux protein